MNFCDVGGFTVSNKKSIGINVLYNLLYQILAIIVPLVTSPYVSHVLGPEKIGIDSYTSSIVFYFIIFAMLGVNNYGNRTIAFNKNSKNLGKIFISIYIIQLSMSIIMFVAYILYVHFVFKSFIIIAYIQSIQILSNMFDVTWYFYGKEEFKVTVIRNSIIKLIGLIAIFVFVNSSNDLWKYSLINAAILLLGQIAIWPFLLKDIKLSLPSFTEIKVHFKPMIILFIPVLSISIFTNLDKIMIGHFSSVLQNGYYENANKIISIPKALITSLGTVMLPRTASLIASGDDKKSTYYVRGTILYTMILSSALMFGMVIVSKEFAILFWGKNFITSGYLIALMSPAFVFSVIGNVVRTQYLIPRSKDKEYTLSLVLGSIVNILVNFLLIPSYGAIGAVVGTLIAEFVMTLSQLLAVKNELAVFNYILSGIPFFINGAIMALFMVWIKNFFTINSFKDLLLLIILGGILYSLLSLITIFTSSNLFLQDLKKDILVEVKKIFGYRV